MTQVLKNYGQTLLLLAGVAVGGLCGAVFGDAAHVVKPVGDIFLNLIFVLIVPLVFFSISTAISKMHSRGNLGRVLLTVLAVFLGMTVISAVLAYISVRIWNPLGNVDRSSILGALAADCPGRTGSIADVIVSSLTVPDFGMLLSKSNLLPLIVFAALTGYAVSATGEKGRAMGDWLEAGSEVTMKMMGLVMYLAPVGLGCYFADTVATIGSQLFGGYLRTFVIYCALALFTFFVLNSIFVLIAKGTDGLKLYWKHIITPAATAAATSSSAAAMPSAIVAARRMGVRQEIAETVIPLGTNIHKDGSVMLAVFKVVFVMLLFSRDLSSPGAALGIIGIAIVAAIVLGAVPSGGFTGEVLICSLLGLSPELTGIIAVIATIADMPSTVLNASSNVVASVLVDSFSAKTGGE